MRTAFSYYGGKGMISGYYPQPKNKKIIELFAGGAAYCCRYFRHDCILIEKNESVVAAWNFIKNPIKEQLRKIPEHIEPGAKISDFGQVDPGFEFILRAAANVGTAGQNKKMESITKIGAIHFHKNTVKKVLYWTDKIQHWKIYHGSYDCFDFGEATYFVDPPYQNAAGEMYKYGAKTIDYDHLKQFVMNLFGQIIITENQKSHWIKSFHKYDLNRICGLNAKHISNERQSEVFIQILKNANQALVTDGQTPGRRTAKSLGGLEAAGIMDEKTAYKIAAEILKPVDGKIPAHRGQQVADKIVAALLSAQQANAADKGEKIMGDDIEIKMIEIIQGGLVQIDFYNNTENKGGRAFCDPKLFFKMIGDSMQKNMQKQNDNFIKNQV